MVQGMAFLSKKGFNPQNQVNRKQVYEAQQDSKLEKERIRKRQEQLRREREDEELWAARHNGDGSQAQLRFMYDAPPGLKKGENAESQTTDVGKSSSGGVGEEDITAIQPGDDAAAVAFRRMLAAAGAQSDSGTTLVDQNTLKERDGEKKLGFAPVLQGSTLEVELDKSNDTRSALEKAVGRRERGSALTLEEQVARFPQLKNAPMAKGMSATDVNVSFKPLGAQLRNVKCLACGIWGHSRGDRECKVTGWDPFGMNSSTTAAPPINNNSSIRPSSNEISQNTKNVGKQNGDDDDRSIYSTSTSGSDDSRRRRKKRKHRKEKKRKHKESSRKRSRRHRSESPSNRRSSSSKSHRHRDSKRY